MVVAGLHPETLSRLAARFSETRNEELIPLRKLRCPSGYTKEYVTRLYGRVARELEKRLPSTPSNRETLFHNTSLSVLYSDRFGASAGRLLDMFGVEALLAPLDWSGVERMGTPNERAYMVNVLFKEIGRALKRLRTLYSVISEEVTNRDNKTCLLLPPKTFGSGFKTVQQTVFAASRSGVGPDEFRKTLKLVSNSLAARKIQKNRYFVGDSKLVFISPAKAGARHGLTPMWEDTVHESSCVIRGRLRFGVSYDPRFHYDCDVANRRAMILPGCHEPQSVSRRTSHVNVAPNDNVRKKT